MGTNKTFQTKINKIFENIISIHERNRSVELKLFNIKEIANHFPQYIRAFNEMRNLSVSKNKNQDQLSAYRNMRNFYRELQIAEKCILSNSQFSNANYVDILTLFSEHRKIFVEMETQFYKYSFK